MPFFTESRYDTKSLLMTVFCHEKLFSTRKGIEAWHNTFWPCIIFLILHFTDGETKAQKKRHAFHKATEWVRGRNRTNTSFSCLPHHRERQESWERCRKCHPQGRGAGPLCPRSLPVNYAPNYQLPFSPFCG